MKNNYSAEKVFSVKILLCAHLLISASAAAFADDTVQARSNHYFQAGIIQNYFEYIEPGDPDIEISGYMVGISGKYTFRCQKGFIISADFEYTYGLNTKYDGTTWDGTPVAEDSYDWIFESRLLAGFEVKLPGDLDLRPYAGLGLRYWYNDVEGAGSYLRKTDYWYIPIGSAVTKKVSESFSWGVGVEYDFFLQGHNRSYISDVNPRFNDVDLRQSSGYGLRISAPLTYKSLQIEPYLYYWNIDESDTDLLTFDGEPYAYVIEPDNETTVYGIRFNYLF